VNPELRVLAKRYAQALQEYVLGRGEAALQEACDLGRQALGDGVGVHDMAAIQHRALIRSLMRVRTREESSSTLRAASRFIVESLLPFEMSHRKSQEVNAALRESEERYRSVVDTARDIIYTLSADAKIMSMNPAFETVTGWSRTEWIGKDFLPLVHPDDRPRAAEIFQAVLKGQVPPIFELGVRAKSGFTIPGEFVATPLARDARVVGVLGVARDITDRKRAERALRHLNEALEEEVKRIAHALHDEAGQLLASVHIALADLAPTLPPPAREKMTEVVRSLKDCEDSLRDLSHELRPMVLENLGLMPALRNLAEKVARRNKLSITVSASGNNPARMPASIESAIYRSTQEALNNVVKHAGARRVRIRVRRGSRAVSCIVQDDGVGLSKPLRREESTGLGLIGIRERVGALGGSFRIASRPQKGATLLLIVPLQP